MKKPCPQYRAVRIEPTNESDPEDPFGDATRNWGKIFNRKNFKIVASVVTQGKQGKFLDSVKHDFGSVW